MLALLMLKPFLSAVDRVRPPRDRTLSRSRADRHRQCTTAALHSRNTQLLYAKLLLL
jgi:hypothetical protein